LPIITENIKRAFAATVTAAATTTLTVNSAEQQQFTGTTTQTVALPVVSTLALGMSYTILNNSTGVVTVQSSGSNTILAMGTGTRVTFTCVSITGTTETSWSSPVVAAGAGKVSNNKILNGDFFINQRAFTSNTANLSYNFDRFLQLVAGGGTTTVTPQVFSPGTAPVVGYEGTNFLQSITATQSAAGDYGYISQRIEDVRTMANQSVVVSFWAKANTGTPKVGIQLVQNFGSGGAPSAEVSTPISAITLTTAWARYEVTITCPSIAGKTIGTTANTSYLALNLWQSAGATFATQASAIGIQNFTLSLWGIQVEAGTAATGFLTATGTYEGELSSCLRYFWAINDPFGNSSYTTGSVQTTTTVAAGLPLPTQMRAVPTLTITNTGVQIIYSNTLATSQAASINGGNATMVRLLVTTAAVLTAGDGVLVIINNGNFSAEL
jgi:hypothetical protein